MFFPLLYITRHMVSVSPMKSESEVAQLRPTPSDPMDCSPPGSSVHGIFQARVLEWGAIAFSADSAYQMPNTVFYSLFNFLLRCNSHTIKLTLLKVHNQMGFNIFTRLSAITTVYFQIIFIIPKRNTKLIRNHLYSLLSQPLATTIILSVSIDLPIMDTNNWNHTIHGIFCLTFFIQCTVFKVYPYCSVNQDFIPFYE